MLAKEPLSFPSRRRYVYDPGIPDRQLWAIGMIVVQWSMTEWFVDMSTRNLIGNDPALLQALERQRNFQQELSFWEGQVKAKAKEPARSAFVALIPRIQNLCRLAAEPRRETARKGRGRSDSFYMESYLWQAEEDGD
jgi:hypothetical protein